MAAKRFSLTKKIAGAIDKNEDDILYSSIDLARHTRSQEVGNCWTYPTINSFESNLIANGLVSAPNEFEGSEWHLSLHQTPGGTRGLDFKRQTLKYEIGEWGGHNYFGISYFATGESGAAVAETRAERTEVKRVIDNLKTYHRYNKPYQPQPSELASIYPNPFKERRFSYDSGITLYNDKDTKNFIQANKTTGYVSFSIRDNSALGFWDYLSNSGRTNKSGNTVLDWHDPLSFKLINKRGRELSINALLQSALNDSIITSSEFDQLSTAFDNPTQEGDVAWSKGKQKDGGGHAVTILGWDDNYIAPTDNKLVELFERFKNVGIQQSTVDALKGWAKSRGLQYTNEKNNSQGAWFIQNSWGEGDKEFQYLPYDFASRDKTFHIADKTGLFGRVDASATLPTDYDYLKDFKRVTKYEEIGYQFDYKSNDQVAAIGVFINEEVDPSMKIRASLYKPGELDKTPVASTEFTNPHTGYQTLRFAAPVKVEDTSELIAVVSVDQSANGESKLDAFNTQAGIDGHGIVDDLIKSAQNQYKPDQVEFYENLPLYYNDLIKVDGNSIKLNTYFGKNKSGWQDLANSEEFVRVNVIYANEQHLLSDNVDIITGSSESDKIFVNDKGNVINAFDGDDTVYIRETKNTIRLGDGNDTAITTEARGRDLVISGGSGHDLYIFSLGKGNHFSGDATIKDFEEGDEIHLYQFSERDLRSLETIGSSTLFDFGKFSLKIKGTAFDVATFNDGVIAA